MCFAVCVVVVGPCDLVGAASDLLVILTGSAGQCARLCCLPGPLLLPGPLVRQAGLLLLLLLLRLLLLLLCLLLLLLPHAILRSS